MRVFVAAAALSLMFAGAAFAANPVGKYTCRGHGPDGGDLYKGTVTVEKTGDTYKVVWVIAGKKTVGTAIGDANFIAISYVSGNSTGLALYGEDGDDWKGVWTYQNGTSMGDESWTRQ